MNIVKFRRTTIHFTLLLFSIIVVKISIIVVKIVVHIVIFVVTIVIVSSSSVVTIIVIIVINICATITQRQWTTNTNCSSNLVSRHRTPQQARIGERRNRSNKSRGFAFASTATSLD